MQLRLGIDFANSGAGGHGLRNALVVLVAFFPLAVSPFAWAQETDGAFDIGAPFTIDQAAAFALAHRPDLAARGYEAEAATYRPRQARALPDPMVMAGLDKYTIDGMGRDWMVTVNQGFPLSRVLKHKAEAAQAAARTARAGEQGFREDVELDARLAYIDVWEGERVVDTTARSRDLAVAAADAALARYRAGAGDQTDVLRAQTVRESYEAALVVAHENLRAAWVALCSAMGLPPPEEGFEPPALPGIDEPGDAGALNGWLAQALEGRPEVEGAQEMIEAAEAAERAAKSGYWPMAQVQLGYMDSNMATDAYQAMVGVSVPLAMGRRGAAVDEARVDALAARSKLGDARRGVAAEVAASHAALRGAVAARQALSQQVLPRAEAAAEAVMGAYAAGRDSIADLIDAQSALFDARLKRDQARADAARRWERLRRAAGYGPVKS